MFSYVELFFLDGSDFYKQVPVPTEAESSDEIGAAVIVIMILLLGKILNTKPHQLIFRFSD